MSSLVLSGDTSGSVTVAVPAVAGTNTVTIPAVTGTAVIAGQNSAITAGTAVASTSGTSIDFTSIPSWVKRITVMFNGVSTNGTTSLQIQLGAGSVETTGYLSTGGILPSAAVVTSTTGLLVTSSASAAQSYYGVATISLFGSNTWEHTSNLMRNDMGYVFPCAGYKALSGTLDRIRITTYGGTDTFDAGSINILYE